MPSKPKATKSRSAITGRYVTKASAKKNPRETVTETSDAVGVGVLEREIATQWHEAEAYLRDVIKRAKDAPPRINQGRMAKFHGVCQLASIARSCAQRASNLQEALDTIQKGGK